MKVNYAILNRKGEQRNLPAINRSKDAYIDLPLILYFFQCFAVAMGPINIFGAVMPSFIIKS